MSVRSTECSNELKITSLVTCRVLPPVSYGGLVTGGKCPPGGGEGALEPSIRGRGRGLTEALWRDASSHRPESHPSQHCAGGRRGDEGGSGA